MKLTLTILEFCVLAKHSVAENLEKNEKKNALAQYGMVKQATLVGIVFRNSGCNTVFPGQRFHTVFQAN